MKYEAINTNEPKLTLVKRLNNAVHNRMIIMGGKCTAEFDGRIKSTLSLGDRHLMIKKDLAIILHGPTGTKPLNWQNPEAGAIEFHLKNDCVYMYTKRIKTQEIMTITFQDVEFISLWHASDETGLQIIGDESDLVKYLVLNPNEIEEGFQIYNTEYQTNVGPVDIRGKDSHGVETIVEVKKRKATPADAHQLKRYVEYFEETEKKKVKGILIAQEFPIKVEQYLKDHKLIAKTVHWSEVFPVLKREKSVSLDKFLKK